MVGLEDPLQSLSGSSTSQTSIQASTLHLNVSKSVFCGTSSTTPSFKTGNEIKILMKEQCAMGRPSPRYTQEPHTKIPSPPAQPPLPQEIFPPCFPQHFKSRNYSWTLLFIHRYFFKGGVKTCNLRGWRRDINPEFPLVQLGKFCVASPQIWRRSQGF